MKWALYDAPMLLTNAGLPDTTARFVLVAHCERADKHGKGSYPGPAALIAATGYDERTIDRAERRLQAAGLLIPRGISHLNTARWDVDMSKRAGGEQNQAETRVARRRAQDAARQKSRRERLKKSQDDANSATIGIDGSAHTGPIVTDSASVTPPAPDPHGIDSDASTVGAVTDSASGCHGLCVRMSRTQRPPNHP